MNNSDNGRTDEATASPVMLDGVIKPENNPLGDGDPISPTIRESFTDRDREMFRAGVEGVFYMLEQNVDGADLELDFVKAALWSAFCEDESELRDYWRKRENGN